MEWEWYSDINTSRLFLHILLKANWKTGSFKGNTIERGQLASSLDTLSIESSLTINEIRTALKHLKSTGEITSKSYSKFTVFTVVKYDSYQGINKQDNIQSTCENTNTSQPVNTLLTTIEEVKKERSKEKDNIDYQQIADMYNNTCVSFPKLNKLSEARKKAIKARMNTYTVDDFKRLFELAEQSDFLKGKNNRDWSATFDWMIKDTNMAKVLDESYKNKGAKKDEPRIDIRPDEGGLVQRAIALGKGTEFSGW